MSYKIVIDSEKNTIDFYNISEMKTHFDNSPIKYDVDEIENPEFYKELSLSVLTPINDGEDFAYRFLPEGHLSLWIENKGNVIGRSYGDLYPNLKEFAYDIFRKVLKTHKSEKIISTIYENDIKIIEIFIKVMYKDGDICIYNEDYSEELASTKELNKLFIANEYVQRATKTAIHYIDNRGKYHWTSEVYNLIEREPRDDDVNHHILLDLFDEKDKIKMENNIAKLGADEFLGEMTYKITLESGKIKYIKINSHKLYDKEGNYLQRNAYTQDITEEYLKNNEILTLQSVVEDVQKSAVLSVQYLDAEGKYHWTDETYKLIDREPREGDENINVIKELMSERDAKEFEKIITGLEHNKKFDDERIWSITTESGKIKYIKGSARIIYDDKGNFVRRSEYAQDITNQVNYQNELIQADRDKTILIQEVHHRVKNNLQLITSFINLEKKFHKDDPERILKITENRLNSLAMIHERIYNEEDMSYINVKSFIEDFDKNLFMFSSSDDIKFITDIEDDLKLTVDVVTPLSLIANELTTNTFKYAFREGFTGDKEIYKSIDTFEKDGLTYVKTVYKDSGMGLPKDFDINTTHSLGWMIILSLVGQLDGEFKLFNDNGLNFIFTFPIK